MLTKEENQLMTRTGPGTPCGDLMRRYWQPVALSEELPPGGAPLPVHLLGEDLVLFRPDGSGRSDASGRDEQVQPALLGLHCSHRGADLSYGRLEDGGLRCIYHGWLYDKHGHCLEQPGEPANSNFHEKIQHLAYPCVDRAGVVFAYLGPGDPPLVPSYDFLTAPDGHVFSIKLFSDCNYLQGSEGNVDYIHLSILHSGRFARGSNGNDASVEPLSHGGTAPHAERVEVELADFGARVCKIRDNGSADQLSLATFILPSLFFFLGHEAGYSVNWHVPIDDTHHWKYTFILNQVAPIDKEAMRRARAEMDADYQAVRNRSNRYRQDRASMGMDSYSGIGNVFQTQDLCVTEGAGPIQDRTQEHLGSTDVPVMAARKLLQDAIRAVQEGREAPYVVRDPLQNHFPHLFARSSVTLPKEADWKEHFRRLDAELARW